MKILANENIGRTVVETLRKQGHDVLWVPEISPGIEDELVISLALSDKRILLTKDKDFGELAFKRKLPHSSVILLRLSDDTPPSTLQVVSAVLKALEKRNDTVFVVVSEFGFRIQSTPVVI